jgi:hypothetical protein
MWKLLTMGLGFNSDAKLVEKVVVAVLEALPATPPIQPARYPVGLEKTSMHVINMLHNMEDNVGVLDIYGMGGIGKTTLAIEVYNQAQSRFEIHCLLRDVKDAKGIAIVDLQMKMVGDLLGKDATMMPRNYAQWFEVIQTKKLLLIVDDISDTKQFYELIPDLKRLALGSRIIITSRESGLLKNIMADIALPELALYPMPELDFPNSLELFIKCAFQKKNLDEVDVVFHDVAKEITKACGGLPLALEVIGHFLVDKRDQLECWREATFQLKKDGDIMTRLQMSYNGLVNDDEKCMFVDIACLMLGHPKEKALEVWKSMGYSTPNWSLNRLIDKCLVKVDAHGQLNMHDLLRDMGQKIVMDKAGGKLELQRHIWDPAMATKILQKEHVRFLGTLHYVV